MVEPADSSNRTKSRASSVYPDLNILDSLDEHNNPTSTARARLSANIHDGCECSDDEVIQGFHRSQSVQSGLVATPDQLDAGPSGTQTINNPKKSDESEHSSFEELCPLKTTAVNSDAENWQFIDHESASLQQPSQPGLLAAESIPSSFQPPTSSPIAHLPLNRRRSDSSLLSAGQMQTTNTIQPSGSSPLSKRVHLSCDRCGKRKSSLRRILQRFKRLLEDRNLSQEATKQQLAAFLGYLEMSQRSVSIDLSEDDDASGDNVLPVESGDVASTVGIGVGESQDAIDPEMGSNHATVGDNDEDDDQDFWFGDDEGIHVYGTDDPYGGQTRQFIHLTDFNDR